VKVLAVIIFHTNGMKQELSYYGKQIARQLRTQYVEGIYRPKYNTVTMKCGLEVTQGIEDGFLFAFHSNYGRIFSYFGERQRMA